MSEPSLYRRVLGEAFDRLPPQIRTAHDGMLPKVMRGRATVVRGGGPTARRIADLMRFPQAAEDVAVVVSFEPVEGGEIWRRSFGGVEMVSVQTQGKGRWAGLIRERFGAVTLGLTFAVRKNRLEIDVARWAGLGLALPLQLVPRGHTYEYVKDGRFCFHVEIGHPFTGLIVRYEGWLEESLGAGPTSRIEE